jgi:AcrR family transcriptional regulator
MFGTKEALLTALVAGAQQRVAPPPGPGPGLGRLRQRAARYIDQISAGDQHARAFLLLWAESVGATPQLRAMFAERDDLFAREIREDLTAGIADGDIRPGIDTEGTALALIATLRGAGLHAIIRGTAPDTTARVRDAVLACLQRSLQDLIRAKASRRLQRLRPAGSEAEDDVGWADSREIPSYALTSWAGTTCIRLAREVTWSRPLRTSPASTSASLRIRSGRSAGRRTPSSCQVKSPMKA